MKVIQNRKEWRHETVIKLIKLNGMSVGDAISEAKDLEKYVFQNEVIIDVGEITSSSPISKKNENQLFSIKPLDANNVRRLLEKKSVADGIKRALSESPKAADTRTQLYIAYIGAGFKNPVVIQEHIKIAERFMFKHKGVSGQDLDEMDLKIKEVLGCCEAGVKEAEKRQHHLKGALKDPLHGPLRIYKNAVRSYSESTKRDPLNVVLEDLAQINSDNQIQDNKPNIAGAEDTEGKQPKISGCMPIGAILYTESGSRIKLISAAQYQG